MEESNGYENERVWVFQVMFLINGLNRIQDSSPKPVSQKNDEEDEQT